MAMIDEGDPAVAQALAAAVSRMGRSIASEPRRVQACLNDELMADARTHRAEIDAVVLAAEETIPDELTNGAFDRPTAMQRLRERGLSDDIATFSIDAWQYSLGLDEPGSPVPTLTTSIPAPLAPQAPTDEQSTILPPPPGAAVPAGVAAGGLVAAVEPSTPSYVPPPPPTVLPSTTAEPSSSGSKRKFWIAGVASLVAVIAVIAVIAVVAGGGDDGDTDVARVELVSATHEAEATPWGAAMVRNWDQTDSGVGGTLTFTNPTDAPISGSHIEAIPKSMAESADRITSPTEFTVLVEDPIVEWNVEVPASGSVTIEYDVETEAEVTEAQLETWRVEAKAVLAEYMATVDDTPPVLTIASPGTGSIVDQPEVIVVGVTEIGSTVDFAGTSFAVDGNGNFQYRIGLAEGTTNFAVRATDAAGNVTDLVYTLTYTPPPPQPAPGGGGGGGGGGGTPPPTTAPNTGGGGGGGGGGYQPAPTPTAVITGSSDGTFYSYVSCGQSCPVTLYGSTTNAVSSWWNDGLGQDAPFNGGALELYCPYSATFQIDLYARNADGVTVSDSVYFTCYP